MDLAEKLQIKPGQSLAVLNPPPDVTLPAATAGGRPSTADVVIGLAIHRGDLDQLGWWPWMSGTRTEPMGY